MKTLLQTSKIDDENWISVSDLMAGLMLVFLFILILYARSAEDRLQNAQEIVQKWQETKGDIYEALDAEFRDDLDRWNAKINKETLTIHFLSPDILLTPQGYFEKGKAELHPEFERILDEFMPRYIKLLVSFGGDIEEVRIEGHTSTEWETSTSTIDAFINNMDLSQQRTRAVLNYSLNMEHEDIQNNTDWMLKTVSANGLSSARPILNEQGEEDKRLSRRVDFRVKTKVEKALSEVIERIGNEDSQ